MDWEYWVAAAVVLVLYGQHRAIMTRRKALEMATTLRPHNIFETEKTTVDRAAEYENYMRHGKAKEKKEEEVKKE